MAIYIEPFRVITSAKTMASLTTTTFTVKGADNIFVQITTDGVTANTGSFRLQFRLNDFNLSQDYIFIDVPDMPTMTMSNQDAEWMIPLHNYPFGEFRIRFVPGGGSPDGTFTALLSASNNSSR